MSFLVDYASDPRPLPPEDAPRAFRAAVLASAACDALVRDFPDGVEVPLGEFLAALSARHGASLGVPVTGKLLVVASCYDPLERIDVRIRDSSGTVSLLWSPVGNRLGRLYSEDLARPEFVIVGDDGRATLQADHGLVVVLDEYWVARGLAEACGKSVRMLPTDESVTVWPTGEEVALVRSEVAARAVDAACPRPSSPEDVSLTWSGGPWSLCLGRWTLKVCGQDCTWVLGEGRATSDMGTYGTYYSVSAWSGDVSTYVSGAKCEQWIENNRDWLSLVSADPAIHEELFRQAQSEDFRSGSCGGCI